ncbi:MAG: molybdopterin-dependent oxidoreductase [Bacteroidetes bacterium]|nr:molybdopterin-dependent oxidoreductase [Bacteroidota bacterium]MBS1541251.1 molybdopterin-dependent oxidoreductase [Bacteroidota bacterium]
MKTNFTIVSIFLITFFLSGCTNTSGNKQSKESAADSSKAVSASDHPDVLSVGAGDTAKFISKQLVVKGDVEHPLTLTVDSLKNMKVSVMHDMNVVCQSGATVNTINQSKGVLLKEILNKAKLKQSNHKDRNFYVVARATDNYKATFSWGEIFNNPAGDNVYVLFEENGKPISQRGSMVLFSLSDTKTGPRHVRWLSSIEVNKVN